MEAEAVALEVVSALEALQIDYMIVGSLSSNAYLRRWCARHGTAHLLEQLLAESPSPE